MNATDKVTTNARELYDTYRFGHAFSYDEKRARYHSFLLDAVSAVQTGQTLFDIGCGSGHWLDLYVAAGVPKDQITAVDLSPANVADLQRKGYTAVCDDVLNLHFDDNVSDFTICSGVIHHTSDPFRAFRELVRVTKPGGHIYLSVYNKWNPYFYLVHRATAPIRYCYWNWSKKILAVVYPIAKVFMQVASLLAVREFLDDATAKTLFMDQVMTPRAHLYSHASLAAYAEQTGCRILRSTYTHYYLMIACVMQVDKARTAPALP